jgi:hypothetical protein
MMAKASEKGHRRVSLRVRYRPLHPHRRTSDHGSDSSASVSAPTRYSPTSATTGTPALPHPDRPLRGDQTGRIKIGDNLVLTSFGGGLTWAAVAMPGAYPLKSRGGSRSEPGTTASPRRSSVLRRQEWRVRSEIASLRQRQGRLAACRARRSGALHFRRKRGSSLAPGGRAPPLASTPTQHACAGRRGSVVSITPAASAPAPQN